MTSSDQARNLLMQGRVREAEAAFRKILESDPDHVEALNVAALAALREGQIDAALTQLERAARIDAASPLTQFHLARAREAAFDFDGAAAAYRAALALQPRLHVARLHLAGLLAKLGQRPVAVAQYARALQDAQREGQWLNAAGTPPALRAVIEGAARMVREYRQESFETLLQPVRAKHGAAEMRRVERALRIQLYLEAAEYVDPRQRPTFFFIPDVPPTAYFDTKLIPTLAGLEAATDAILAELQRLLPSSAGRERVFDTEALERENLRGADAPPSWTGYYFFRHGERRDDNCSACPATARALDALPLAHIREHGPEVLYSVFTAGTHLLPHRGVTNARVVGHLPLIVPRDCALRVGGEEHVWQPGRAVVFDDTYEHEAWNRSDTMRVVMIFDLWNPHLNEAEQEAIAELIPAMGDFRKAVEAG